MSELGDLEDLAWLVLLVLCVGVVGIGVIPFVVLLLMFWFVMVGGGADSVSGSHIDGSCVFTGSAAI